MGGSGARYGEGPGAGSGRGTGLGFPGASGAWYGLGYGSGFGIGTWLMARSAAVPGMGGRRCQIYFLRDERGDGTFAPDRRASDSPMAMACFRLFTRRPEPPDRSLPRFISCIARSTFCPAFGPYRRLRLLVRLVRLVLVRLVLVRLFRFPPLLRLRLLLDLR